MSKRKADGEAEVTAEEQFSEGDATEEVGVSQEDVSAGDAHQESEQGSEENVSLPNPGLAVNSPDYLAPDQRPVPVQEGVLLPSTVQRQGGRALVNAEGAVFHDGHQTGGVGGEKGDPPSDFDRGVGIVSAAGGVDPNRGNPAAPLVAEAVPGGGAVLNQETGEVEVATEARDAQGADSIPAQRARNRPFGFANPVGRGAGNYPGGGDRTTNEQSHLNEHAGNTHGNPTRVVG